MTRRVALFALDGCLALGLCAVLSAPVGELELPAESSVKPRMEARAQAQLPGTTRSAGASPFRPATAPTSGPTPAATEPPRFRLIGVIAGPERATAMVQMQASDAPIRVQIGEKLSFWTVAEINRKSLVLEGNGVRSILLLDAPAATPTESAAGSPAPEQPTGQTFSIAPSSVIQRIKR